jgi:hypothetical protein
MVQRFRWLISIEKNFPPSNLNSPSVASVTSVRSSSRCAFFPPSFEDRLSNSKHPKFCPLFVHVVRCSIVISLAEIL